MNHRGLTRGRLKIRNGEENLKKKYNEVAIRPEVGVDQDKPKDAGSLWKLEEAREWADH